VSIVNITDIILLLILGFAGYRGYQRGFLVSLLSIVAFFVATLLAFLLLDWGVQMLDDLVEGFNGAFPYLAFILIFIGVAIAINLIGKVLKKAIDLTLLGGFDSIGGGMIGILKWVFGLSLLIWFSQNVGIEVPPDMQNGSLLYSRIEPVAPFVIDSISAYLPFLKSLFQSVTEYMRPAIP